jgi:hypothetical protein
MKSLRFLFTPVFLLFFGQLLHGQDVRVRVVSDGEPLGYAYIYVDGIYRTAADSTGMGTLSVAGLQPGDTISAGFVGMEDGFVVYSGNPTQSVEVKLYPSHIGEVVVQGKDRSQEYFRRYVKNYYVGAPEWSSWEQRGTYYSLTFTITNHRVEQQGNYSQIFASSDAVKYYNIDQITLQPTLSSDTTGLSQSIENMLLAAWKMAQAAASFHKGWTLNRRDMIVKYRGKEAGRHVFLILKPTTEQAGISDGFQALISVDETTKAIVSSESLMLNNNLTSRQKADYRLIEYQGKQGKYLLPIRMEGSLVSSGYTTHYLLDQITVHYYPHRKVPRRGRNSGVSINQ